MAKEANPVRKRRMVKILIPVVLVLVVVAVWLFVALDIGNIFHKAYEGPEYPRFITVPGIDPEQTTLAVSRATVLDFDGVRWMESEFEEGQDYCNRTVQVTDTYTLQNQGDTSITFDLIYPISGYGEEQDDVTVTVDGIPVEDWWGMNSFVAVDTEDYEQTIGRRLRDGTDFAVAFPNWPEQGTPNATLDNLDGMDDVAGSKITYAFAYYLQTVTIPAGGSTVVSATYPLESTGKILFPACYQAVACQSHTLVLEHTDHVKLEDENLGIADLSGTVELNLDPARTDYFMEFDVEP